MPGWLTGLDYKQPERLTSDETRQNRLLSELTRQRKLLEDQASRLYPANNKIYYQRLKEFEAKFSDEIETRRARVLDLEDRGHTDEYSRTLRSAKSGLFKLLQMRSSLQQRAATERRANQFKASAADGRFYHPDKAKRNPRTVFGTDAWLRMSVDEVARRLFKNPLLAIPCIQRAVRQEVMFANGHAGRGHHKRKRRSGFSNIGC